MASWCVWGDAHPLVQQGLDVYLWSRENRYETGCEAKRTVLPLLWHHLLRFWVLDVARAMQNRECGTQRAPSWAEGALALRGAGCVLHRHKLASSSLRKASGGLCPKPRMSSAVGSSLVSSWIWWHLAGPGGAWRGLVGPGGAWWGLVGPGWAGWGLEGPGGA